jgi:hypothetical protein
MSTDKSVTVGNIKVRVIKGILTDQQVCCNCHHHHGHIVIIVGHIALLGKIINIITINSLSLINATTLKTLVKIGHLVVDSTLCLYKRRLKWGNPSDETAILNQDLRDIRRGPMKIPSSSKFICADLDPKVCSHTLGMVTS